MRAVPILSGLAVMCVLGLAQSPVEGAKEKARPVGPWLGIETRYPTAKEAESLGLSRGVRIKGQIITEVARAGPGEKAGLGAGDVMLALDDNDLYSFDDIRDFIATSRPGRKVKVRVKRGKPLKEEDVALTIGERILSDIELKTLSFTWDFASLAQLETALKHAKKEGKRLIVGISGAET